MTKNLVIISAGKFGREMYSMANQAIAGGAPWRIKGFLDSRTDALKDFKYPVGIIASFEAYAPQSDDLFLCAIGDPAQRREYIEKMLARGGQFATLIHPTAVVGHNVQLGTGVMIAPFSMIGADARLGNYVYMGPQSVFGHDNQIGDWCQFSGQCCLGGCVTVEELCFFGMQTVVVPGVRIGRQAFVGVGSVVLRNVRAGVKVFGNPAVQIGNVETK